MFYGWSLKKRAEHDAMESNRAESNRRQHSDVKHIGTADLPRYGFKVNTVTPKGSIHAN